MTDAPAISSILSPEYLAEFTSHHYGVAASTTCRILKTGINHSYLITTPDAKYVLRVYYVHWRTEREITEELRVLSFLKEHGIAVSYPIKSVDGTHVQRINAVEGTRYAVLFSFAEGKSIRIPSEEVCYTLGVEMARMHQLTVDKTVLRKCYDANTLVDWAYEFAKQRFPEDSEEMRYFERAASKISTEFAKADASSLRYGIVHLDLWYENMKVRNESELTIFDFDNCGNGWLFLDIGYSLMLLFRNEPDKERFKQKCERFYQGYESITSISEEEKRLMPYGGLAIWLHYTGIHVERFNDFSNQFLSDEFLKYWIHTVNQWMEFNGIKI